MSSALAHFDGVGMLDGLAFNDVVHLTDGRSGSVKYIGLTAFSETELMIGIQLRVGRGEHGGFVAGREYFSCEKNEGTFAFPSLIKSVEPQKSVVRVSFADEVVVKGYGRGTIQFIGRTMFGDTVLYGVELDGERGHCDGSYDGIDYFITDQNYGVFVTKSRLRHITEEEFSEEYDRASPSASSSGDDTDDDLLELAAQKWLALSQQQLSNEVPTTASESTRKISSTKGSSSSSSGGAKKKHTAALSSSSAATLSTGAVKKSTSSSKKRSKLSRPRLADQKSEGSLPPSSPRRKSPRAGSKKKRESASSAMTSAMTSQSVRNLKSVGSSGGGGRSKSSASVTGPSSSKSKSGTGKKRKKVDLVKKPTTSKKVLKRKSASGLDTPGSSGTKPKKKGPRKKKASASSAGLSGSRSAASSPTASPATTPRKRKKSRNNVGKSSSSSSTKTKRSSMSSAIASSSAAAGSSASSLKKRKSADQSPIKQRSKRTNTLQPIAKPKRKPVRKRSGSDDDAGGEDSSSPDSRDREDDDRYQGLISRMSPVHEVTDEEDNGDRDDSADLIPESDTSLSVGPLASESPVPSKRGHSSSTTAPSLRAKSKKSRGGHRTAAAKRKGTGLKSKGGLSSSSMTSGKGSKKKGDGVGKKKKKDEVRAKRKKIAKTKAKPDKNKYLTNMHLRYYHLQFDDPHFDQKSVEQRMQEIKARPPPPPRRPCIDAFTMKKMWLQRLMPRTPMIYRVTLRKYPFGFDIRPQEKLTVLRRSKSHSSMSFTTDESRSIGDVLGSVVSPSASASGADATVMAACSTMAGSSSSSSSASASTSSMMTRAGSSSVSMADIEQDEKQREEWSDYINAYVCEIDEDVSFEIFPASLVLKINEKDVRGWKYGKIYTLLAKSKIPVTVELAKPNSKRSKATSDSLRSLAEISRDRAHTYDIKDHERKTTQDIQAAILRMKQDAEAEAKRPKKKWWKKLKK